MVNSVKVFKKTSPNDKVTAYLSRRDFINHVTHTAPVDGVVLVDEDYLKGRKVFASVMLTYRYGREADEMMGLHFTKEFELVNIEIPPTTEEEKLTSLQKRLKEKLGANARPFTVSLPESAPNSVTLEPMEGDEEEKPLGVLYDLKLYVGDNNEEKPHRRNSVSFAVRRVQFAPSKHDRREPYAVVNKNFTLSPGTLSLEVGLHKDIYFHGELVETIVKVVNSSKRTVKKIAAQVVQHVEVTMTNAHFSRVVACLETSEGCPITPDSKYDNVMDLTPLASNMKRFGIALDGKLKDADANLASSTISNVSKELEDALGITVSYSVRVKLLCGAISGELMVEVPFKLMHPDPETTETKPEEGLEFEEFSHLRRGLSVDEDLADE